MAIAAASAYLAWRGASAPVLRPTRGPIVQTVVSSGRVLPPAEIHLGALITSTVREVHVREGDPVEVGQLLVQLDDGEARAAVDKAESAVAQAQTGRYEITQLSAPSAEAGLRQAEAAHAQAKRRLEQEQALFAGGVSTQAALDDARTSLTLAEAQREAAELQVKAASAGGSKAAVAAASVAQAKAQLAVATEQLARTRILSPVKGTVLGRHIEPGDAVVVGSRLLHLSRVGATRLVIEPDERNLASLEVGQPATASAEAFPADRFDAEVQYIAPSVDPQRGTVEVRLSVPAPPDYLRPHMTVSVEIEVGRRDDATLLPRRAVRDLASDQPYVLAIRDGRAVKTLVGLGVRGDDRVEVTGVDPDAWVIADPTSGIAPGDRVRPVSED